jgi:hypothetical protein
MTTLEIKGQHLPFKLTTAALLRFEAATGKSFIEVMQSVSAGESKLSFGMIYRLAFEGLVAGGKALNQPYTKSWEDFLEDADGVAFSNLSALVADAVVTRFTEPDAEPAKAGN